MKIQFAILMSLLLFLSACSLFEEKVESDNEQYVGYRIVENKTNTAVDVSVYTQGQIAYQVNISAFSSQVDTVICSGWNATCTDEIDFLSWESITDSVQLDFGAKGLISTCSPALPCYDADNNFFMRMTLDNQTAHYTIEMTDLESATAR